MRAILLILALTACQPGLQRSVQSLSAAGDFVEATEIVLRAHELGDAKATELLPQVAQDAYDLELDRAQMAEADDDLPASLAAYDRLLALEARVVAAGGPALAPEVQRQRNTVARDTATLYAAKASVAYDDGRWDDALAGWRMAEGTDAQATDSERYIPQALTRLGDQSREAGRWREAIDHYGQAVQAGGGEEPRMWAAAIHAALGRHALRMGACRKAVDELTAATALPFDIHLGDDLDRAKTCAVREVIVHPFTDLVEGGVDNPNLGVLLVDQLGHHLRSQGSRYIRLIDPKSAAAKLPSPGPGQRFDVNGHLTRIDVDRIEPTTRRTSTTGKLKVPCEAGSDARCDEEVTVAFDLTTESLKVNLAGNIKVVDPVTGEQVTTRPLEIRVEKSRQQATKPKITDVRGYVVQAEVGRAATERTVGLTGDARTWFTEAPPLPDPARITDEAVVRLAATAAEAVLTAIDREDPLADPEALTLITPVASASEVRFGEAELTEEIPEALELRGMAIEDEAVEDEAVEAPAEGEDPTPEGE